MGACISSQPTRPDSVDDGQDLRRTGASPAVRKSAFHSIQDQYETFEQLQAALRKAGLESSNLILGIDFTKSNQWTGEKTYGNRCLHTLSGDPTIMNPYQSVIRILGQTLAVFDDDNMIPVFGFGDTTTTDKSCFPFFPDRPCHGFDEVLTRYNELVPNILLSGPTNFAPVIRKAIETVQSTLQYHILVIICDGQVTKEQDTIDAIVAASYHPLSIITVGVGDGPWEKMHEFDDQLPERQFDNFQFVEYHKLLLENTKNPELAFALEALMEIPEQYKEIRGLGLL
eukprot:TRINITY_DN5731_c0_g1_i1.p1 TRINITY_DN5731_c0_g1~~TRINITY_DN5731_c0_g1_i1.p1  ORF type:complete len:285 (-),score=43.35 TRINITY_DN5731_c0_g1_i1:112-966(-)